jgi:hypothetical protein
MKWLLATGLGLFCFTKQNNKTTRYIKNLDIKKFEQNGSDFTNHKYSPLRLGKPLEQIDRVYDYDFEQLAQIEKKLEGINRRKALRHIFKVVTKGAKTNTEKHHRILEFLQKSGIHSPVQPIYPNKMLVCDPLVLLELAEMRCGHIARVAVDLFSANGFNARLVQLGGHVIAEVYYDNAWHYLDADVFGGGETIVNNKGIIPSIAELSREPYRIDSLAHYFELNYTGMSQTASSPYPSWFYFGRNAYSKGTVVYYEKTATEEQELNNIYGWNYYKVVDDNERTLYDMELFYQPGAVTFKNIHIDDCNLNLEWYASEDNDSDLLGYKVYISRTSRNWHYSKFNGSEELAVFWSNSNGWRPEDYDNLFKEPHSEIAFIKTEQTSVDAHFESPGIYYITVMPYDAHGESVGKILYQMSEELKIPIEQW